MPYVCSVAAAASDVAPIAAERAVRVVHAMVTLLHMLAAAGVLSQWQMPQCLQAGIVRPWGYCCRIGAGLLLLQGHTRHCGLVAADLAQRRTAPTVCMLFP